MLFDFGFLISDCGLDGAEGKGQGAEDNEFGGRTRRRPIKRDYVAARCGSGNGWNAEVGMIGRRARGQRAEGRG
jgi:hypothetical protein